MFPAEHRRPSRSSVSLLALAVLAAVLSWIDGLAIPEADAAPARRITFPVHRDHADELRWSDTWGAARSGGRSHEGVDMLGPKMLPLVAARSGNVTWGRFDNGRGSMLQLTDDDGWVYSYVHLNNDTPGTDDGAAACTEVFSPKLCTFIGGNGRFTTDVRVNEGEIIGYLGDSGNAEWTSPHLHFEVARPDGAGGSIAVNPTPYVDAAKARLDATVGSFQPPPAVAPGAEGFEDHLWYRLHGRYPSTQEVDEFTAEVAEDGLWVALADELDESTTASMVDRLYLAFFRRYPDASGIEYWIGQRADGHALEEIAEWFAMSDEFSVRYDGTTFDQFLNQLYGEVLGRTPDASGKAYWLDLLERDVVTRGMAVVYFTESAEMQELAGERNELVALTLLSEGRSPSRADIERWQTLRAGNDLPAALAAWFAAS
ncbi:MAG: DUF4214 domain-containing protein [Actinomycetota bacterium]